MNLQIDRVMGEVLGGRGRLPALSSIPLLLDAKGQEATHGGACPEHVRREEITRRGFLRGLGGGIAAATLGTAILPALTIPSLALAPDPSRPGSPLDALTPVIHPVLDLFNANTGESWSGAYFSWNENAYSPDAIRALNWFFRDWRESKAAVMDPRLYWALSALSQGAQADGHSGQIIVTSGYRTRRTNSGLEGAAPNSLHMRARAVDLGIAGVSTRQIRDYLIWLQVGGVGHYPNRFVHVDTGRVRTW